MGKVVNRLPFPPCGGKGPGDGGQRFNSFRRLAHL